MKNLWRFASGMKWDYHEFDNFLVGLLIEMVFDGLKVVRVVRFMEFLSNEDQQPHAVCDSCQF